MRMFERDKDELRSFGIQIETIPLEEEETSGYKLDRKTFYLPYLSLSSSGGKPGSQPRKTSKLGYRALVTLVVEPDDKHELRNFRVARIQRVSVNSGRSQSADYEIPADFNLREHARSKKPWELGDGAGEDAVVDFRNPTGAAKAAARLGVAIEGASDRRKFRIRRVDSFARWLLSFGGEAVPVSPAWLVSEFNRQVQDAHAIYGAAND